MLYQQHMWPVTESLHIHTASHVCVCNIRNVCQRERLEIMSGASLFVGSRTRRPLYHTAPACMNIQEGGCRLWYCYTRSSRRLKLNAEHGTRPDSSKLVLLPVGTSCRFVDEVCPVSATDETRGPRYDGSAGRDCATVNLHPNYPTPLLSASSLVLTAATCNYAKRDYFQMFAANFFVKNCKP